MQAQTSVCEQTSVWEQTSVCAPPCCSISLLKSFFTFLPSHALYVGGALARGGGRHALGGGGCKCRKLSSTHLYAVHSAQACARTSPPPERDPPSSVMDVN